LRTLIRFFSPVEAVAGHPSVPRTIEQKFDEATFVEAFIEHTKQNFEAVGQTWSAAAEDAIRDLLPARWRAIQQVLENAAL
jgi:hypothetical protein